MSYYIILNLFFPHCFLNPIHVVLYMDPAVSFNHCLIFHQMNIFQQSISSVDICHAFCLPSIGSHFCVWGIVHSVRLWGKQRQPPRTGTVADLATGARSPSDLAAAFMRIRSRLGLLASIVPLKD